MVDTFRIYKGTTKVVEGESPLTISGLEPNTKVEAGTYQATRVTSTGESTKTNIPAFTTALPAPVNATGTFNEDGSVTGDWDAVSEAQAYLVHYGDANVSDPSKAVKMGYTETNTWTLDAADVPTLSEGDTLNLFIQAYPTTGVGANDIEKARYLHDGNFLGSAWSEPIVLTKTP